MSNQNGCIKKIWHFYFRREFGLLKNNSLLPLGLTYFSEHKVYNCTSVQLYIVANCLFKA